MDNEDQDQEQQQQQQEMEEDAPQQLNDEAEQEQLAEMQQQMDEDEDQPMEAMEEQQQQELTEEQIIQLQQQQQEMAQQQMEMQMQMQQQLEMQQNQEFQQQQYYDEQEGIPIEEKQAYDYQHAMPDQDLGNDYGNEDQQEYGQEREDMDYTQHQESPEDKMKAMIQEIIEIYQDSGQQPWSDPEFPADDAALYIDPLNPPEYADQSPNVPWYRPQQIFPSEEPMMMKDGLRPGDVKQGILGDCWLLGSFLCLATNPELLENLIYYDGIKQGFSVFQFFKDGGWKYVVVDTRIPCHSETKTPLYGHCTDPQEFWVPLIEKAYAKLHGNYEILNGGKMVEGMVDLTGGVSEKYNLKAPETKELLENGQFWKDMKKYHKLGYLIGCAQSVKGDDGKQEDGAGPNGIYFNHAYGILRMEDANVPPENLQLLYMRNPWGTGPGEWTGKFADEDESWDDFRGLKDKLGYAFKNDGNWWMAYADWKTHYNKVYVCKIFPSNWSQFSITGEWRGVTHGGPYPAAMNEDNEETKDASTQLDTDEKWFNNPQYRLTVHKRTQVIISLMQEDINISKKPYIPVNFVLLRVKSKRDRLWQIDRESIVLEAAKGLQRFKQREITTTVWLEPTHNKKNVHYVIVPNIEHENVRPVDERPFFLRVFASEHVDLVELPRTIEQSFKCEWGLTTAGGRRVTDTGKENQYWCRNPQFFLNITKACHLKFILRKKGGKRFRGIPIGLTVTKAQPPTEPPAAEIIGKGSNRGAITLPSSLPSHGQTYAMSLRQTVKKEKGGENIPEFEPPCLDDQLERKLQILPNEWFKETTYKSDDVAALYQFYQPTQGPFIVVPSMRDEDKQVPFELTIYSSQPVEVVQLQDSCNKALAGKWTEKSAGGCHLYDKEFEAKPDSFTWGNNPKFLLELNGNETTVVKIVLSRPEKAWKKAIGMSLVGCMIGFYVFPYGLAPDQKNLVNKEGRKFVPWNEINEEIALDYNKDGYIIMPTCYEPGKQGPFILSVSTDVEFKLTQQEN